MDSSSISRLLSRLKPRTIEFSLISIHLIASITTNYESLAIKCNKKDFKRKKLYDYDLA